MLSGKLVELIERHADEICESVVKRLRGEPRLPDLGALSDSEIQHRYVNVFQDLGHWLVDRDDERLAQTFGGLGRERCGQGVPLHEVVLVSQFFKRGLLEYLRRQGAGDSALELYAEEEVDHLVDSFFDRVVYSIVQAYEEALLKTSVRTSP